MLRRILSVLFTLVFGLGITLYTRQQIIKRDETVNQPALITMIDLGYENSETTNAIVREFKQSGYSGLVYSLKINSNIEDSTESLDIDLLKCEDPVQAQDFYKQLLVDIYHSEREMSTCGIKDNCHIPKLTYEKTLSQLYEMDSNALNVDLAYALHDPLTFSQEHKNNQLFIFNDPFVLCIETWGIYHPLTENQLNRLMKLFDQADVVFKD